MDIIKPYTPKKFGKEYCSIRGTAQYPMFMAVALGVKPCFDDWIPIDRFDEFVKVCRDYGLYVETDVVFTEPPADKKDVVGSENLTTTFFTGKGFAKNIKDGEVHVFVSSSRKAALEAKKTGWYSVVINNRSINKPFVDHLRFGKALGFPDCCVDFFRKYNNWNIYSHPYETFKNTPVKNGRARGSYHCNNFLMDNTYFFIHHLPCSYRCESTISLASRVEEKIREVEPEFVKNTVELLTKPLLVFGERHFIIFDGKIKDGALSYSNAQYLTNPGRLEENVGFFDFVKKANRITIDKDKIHIMKNRSIIKTVDKKEQWFMINFD